MTLISLNLTTAGIAAAAFLAVYYVYFQLTTGAARRQLIAEKGCLPVAAYPQKDPFLGLDVFRGAQQAFKERRGLERIRNRYNDMGTYTFSLNIMGRNVISTIEPDNLKTIQALNFKQWSLGKQRIGLFRRFLGRGIFTTDGAEWAHSRNMLRPNFSREHIRDLDSLEHHIQHLVTAIPRDGSMVDLQDLFFRLTIDSATDFLFGESTNTLAPGLATVSASKFAESFNRGQETLSQQARYGLFAFLAPKEHFEHDIKFVHDFIDTFVEKGLANRSKILAEPEDARYIFLNELVKQTTDKYTIRSELLNILLAGRDTTASLLSNVWWTLSKRPDVYAALREEVDALNGEMPTFESIKNMKYLRGVMNESLRVHPVVPLNSREALVDTTLPRGGGPDGKSPIFVRKGQIVAWSVYAMHRRKDYFGEDADEFRPERWFGENALKPGWEYLPFNGGARICLGQQFALTEAGYTTVRLMQEFKAMESRDDQPWTEWLTLTCVGLNGCKVALTPYSNA